MLEKQLENKIIKVTFPMHREIKKGTLNQIIKDCDLSIDDLMK